MLFPKLFHQRRTSALLSRLILNFSKVCVTLLKPCVLTVHKSVHIINNNNEKDDNVI